MNILNLYPEDFASLRIWSDVCDSLKLPNDSCMICIEYKRADNQDLLEVNYE